METTSLGWADAAPTQFAEMDEAVGTAEVDEGAKVGQAADDAIADAFFFQGLEQFFFLLAAPFADGDPF